MDFIATERFIDGRYGKQEYAYYATPTGIEERRAHRDRADYVLTRYLIADGPEKQAIITKIRELSGSERKSSRGHNDLERLMRRLPSVYGFVAIAEADSPDRKVIVSAAQNLPSHLAHSDWALLFR